MKTVSAKLYPTPTQERKLMQCLNVTRWVYNRGLEHRMKAWKRRKQSVSFFQQSKLLTKWRSRIAWLRDVPFNFEEKALKRLSRSMDGFFRRVKAGATPGFPRFKGRNRWRSFEVLDVRTKYLRDGGKVYVRGVGPVKYRGMMAFVGKVKGLRVVKRERGWYVQLIVDDGPKPVAKPIERRIGIDVGLMSFATLSDGTKFDNPRWYRAGQRRLRFLQRIASRRKKGSNRRRKANAHVARHHERIADTRRDWIHKLTRQLVDDFDLIAIEKLNVQGMVRSRFAKSISDAAWGQFVRILSSKAESAGAIVVSVDPRNTSRECSECGRIAPKLLSDRVHSCECGYIADRDENAARNILRRATPGTRGERCTPEVRSLNREVSANVWSIADE